MRVLAFYNYDIKSISDAWTEEGRNAPPSQHLWGVPELQRRGHDVCYLDYEYRAALKTVRELRVLGDLDLQKRALAVAAEYDAIYCAHQPSAAVLALLRKWGWLRMPVVALGYQSPRSTGRAMRIWCNGFVAGLDRLLCLSDAMERDFLGLGMPAQRHYHARTTRPEGDPHFISVGKSFRDFESLIQGFPFDRARLTVLGAGEAPDLSAPASAEGRSTVQNGWIDWKEFVRILPDFQALVLPVDLARSRGHNAIGLTAVTEALASGLPVVVTQNPYIGVDIETEDVGAWVAPYSPEGWRETINAICDDPGARLAMGRRARSLAEHRINIESFADTLEQTLLEVSAGRAIG